jgi:hypothetical protein
MKKEDITNQVLVAILRALHTQNEILADALDEKIKSKKEIRELVSADTKIVQLLVEMI